MLRRALALGFAVVLAALLAGCSGQDAARAQEVVSEASAALEQVRSASFNLQLTASQDGSQLAAVTVAGAGYLSGPNRGDFRMKLAAGSLLGSDGLQLIERRHVVFLDDGSGWRRLPVPAGAARTAAVPGLPLDLARYVKDVRVAEDAVADGEPSVKVEGTLDTAAMLSELMRSLPAGLGQNVGSIPDLASHVGDTHVLIFVSKATHLPVRAFVDLQLEQAGKRLGVSLDFSLSHVNEPVSIAAPA